MLHSHTVRQDHLARSTETAAETRNTRISCSSSVVIGMTIIINPLYIEQKSLSLFMTENQTSDYLYKL